MFCHGKYIPHILHLHPEIDIVQKNHFAGTRRRGLEESKMPTPDQCEATYHSGIGSLLTAAYQREFTMLEMGRCKTKFPAFDDWYATLNAEQRTRVDKVLIAEYGE